MSEAGILKFSLGGVRGGVPWLLLALVLLASIGIPLAVGLWGRWLAKQPAAPRWTVALPIAVVALIALDLGLAGWTVFETFYTPEADTSERATQLAKGISEILNCHAFAMALMLSFTIPLGIATLITRLRRGRSD
jgi:formate hydrogenlyase subunit 3/multisubunit Na+/H+ antiporter MnhD subunit